MGMSFKQSTLILLPILITTISYQPCHAVRIIDQNHMEISSGLIRMGKDIAYYNEKNELCISICEWVQSGKTEDPSYQCRTTKLRTRINPLTESWPLQFEYQDRILRARTAGIGFYDPAADILRIVVEPDPAAKREMLNPSCVVVRNIFPVVDQYNHVFESGFYTNLAFTLPVSYLKPEPTEAYVALVTELELDSLQPYQIYFPIEKGRRDYYRDSDVTPVSGDVNRITPTLRSGETTRSRRLRLNLSENGEYALFFTFGEHKTSDASRPGKQTSFPRILKEIDGRHYLVDLIPLSDFRLPRYPKLFGWRITAGSNANQDEVFLPGTTYLIDGPNQIKSLTSLGTANNPVFVKFAPGKRSLFEITKEGGAGVLVDHTIFTSALDKHPRRGAMIDSDLLEVPSRPSRTGDYQWAIAAIKGMNQKITNSQFYYASTALTKPVESDLPLELRNVLIENCDRSGAELCDWGIFVNSTVRNCNHGIVVERPAGMVFNSIFADNHGLGCSRLPAYASHNVFSNNGRDTGGAWLGEKSLTAGKRNISLFTNGDGGDCYLNPKSVFAKKLIGSLFVESRVIDPSREKPDPGLEEDNKNITHRGFNYPSPAQ